MSNLPFFIIPNEIHEDRAVETFRSFVRITGHKPWAKRLEHLRKIWSDPFKAHFYEGAFAVERAMAHLQLYIQIHERYPPVNDGAQFSLLSFMATTTSVYERLSENGRRQLQGRLNDALKPGNRLAPLAFEMTTIQSVAARKLEIAFSDYETPGGFDFLVRNNGLEIELECKSLAEDIGRRIKRDAALDVYCRVKNEFSKAMDGLDGGLIIKLVAAVGLGESKARDVASTLVLRAVRTGHEASDDATGMGVQVIHFDITRSPFADGRKTDFSRKSLEDFVLSRTGESNREIALFFRPGKAALLLVLASRKGDNDVNEWLREPREAAERQFTKNRPGILCVNFEGLSNAQIDELAVESASGFSISATRILDSEDRSHLVTVAYFGSLTDEVLRREGGVVTVAGAAYVMRNPRHPLRGDERTDLFRARKVDRIVGT